MSLFTSSLFTSRLRPVLAAALVACAAAPVLAHGAEEHAEKVEAALADHAGVRVGDLVLTEAFARATRPGAPVAGGFLAIANEGNEADRLIAASSSVAGHMEIHEMTMADGVMKMRALAGGLPIPAGETVMLKPGGYHVMFMDLKAPLTEGETVTVTLTFEKAGEVSLPLAILAPDAKSFEAGRGAGH